MVTVTGWGVDLIDCPKNDGVFRMHVFYRLKNIFLFWGPPCCWFSGGCISFRRLQKGLAGSCTVSHGPPGGSTESRAGTQELCCVFFFFFFERIFFPQIALAIGGSYFNMGVKHCVFF